MLLYFCGIYISTYKRLQPQQLTSSDLGITVLLGGKMNMGQEVEPPLYDKFLFYGL